MNKPFLVEVVGCPWDSYWNHSILGKIIAPYEMLMMKRIVKKADYVIYVTDVFLQRRYLTNGKYTSISNVFITHPEDEVIAQRRKKIESLKSSSFVIGTAAAVDVQYKDQEYVIRALKYNRV